jgi:polysaccharide biosynthesis transport protein
VMIVRARLTRKKAITRSFELLSRSRIRIIGAVINDVDLNMENFYTYARKGYGYMYYSGKGNEPAYGNRNDDKE